MDGQRAGRLVLLGVLVLLGTVTAHLAVDQFGGPVVGALAEGAQDIGIAPPAPLTLEAWYTFDSSDPTAVYDRTNRSRDLELRGPQRVNASRPGVEGQETVLSFAAGDSAYEAPSGMISEDVAISFWFRPGNWSGDEWDGNVMWQLAEDAVNFRIVGGKPDTSLVFQRIGTNGTSINLYSRYRGWRTDEWYHIVVQQYDDRWELYIDGELDAQKVTPMDPAMSSTGFELGSANGRFDGMLDDVRVYSGAPLTPEQIAALRDGERIT